MDNRISWIKSCIYAGLGLSKDSLFENLLARNDRKVANELTSFLDQPSDKYPPAIIFYCVQHEVEEMVELVEGKHVKSWPMRLSKTSWNFSLP